MKKRRRRRKLFFSLKSHTNQNHETFFPQKQHFASLSSLSLRRYSIIKMSGGCPPTEETRKETNNNAVDDDDDKDDDDDDDKDVSMCEFRVACVQFEPAHGAFTFYHRFKHFSTNFCFRCN